MNWFKNQKIAVKLTIGFGLAIIAMTVISIIGYHSLSQLGDATDQMYKENVLSIKSLSYANAAVLIQRGDTRNITTVKTPAERENWNRSAEEQIQKAEEYLNQYSKHDLSDDQKEKLQKFNGLWETYKSARKQSVQAALLLDDETSNRILNDQAAPALTEARKILRDLIDEETTAAQKTSTEINNVADSSKRSIMLFIILGIGISILSGWFISSLVIKPIAELSEVILELSQGSLRKRMQWDSNDEIGKSARLFNVLITNLEAFVNGIYDISRGKLQYERKAKNDRNQFAPALESIIKTLKDLKTEMDLLTDAYINGLTDYSIDVTKFEGGYRDIVAGANAATSEIIKVVREGTKTLENIAKGDLTARMEGEYKNNYQHYQAQINTVGNSLMHVIRQVSEAVSATASASTEISSSTEEMAAGAQEQSAQASEVASAVEEMAKTIVETTLNAENAAKAAKDSGETAKEGGKVVNETVAGMVRISDVVKKSAETVQALGKSSDEIGAIVQVIDEIADQTNLLALNAAIEAARAGEQGRGFAVVADEVRKLAERTTKATKEIASMIKQIQQDTHEAVKSMEVGTKEVESGRLLAAKAGESLTQIISGAQESIDIITQVATASQEQAAAAEQISKNIESISSVTEQSASGIQQIARAAEDLDKLTLNLQKIIMQFKTEEDGGKLNEARLQQGGKKNLRLKL